ncbi:Fe2+ or Zn2+ uptake regulation protein [Sinorhizobium fredii]
MLQATHADESKLTKNQSLVLAVLKSSEQPLSAYSILDRLREHGLKARSSSIVRSTSYWKQVEFIVWRA